jgi:hypothetical protein
LAVKEELSAAAATASSSTGAESDAEILARIDALLEAEQYAAADAEIRDGIQLAEGRASEAGKRLAAALRWRLAKCCHMRASALTKHKVTSETKKASIALEREGLEACRLSLAAVEEDADAHRWVIIVIVFRLTLISPRRPQVHGHLPVRQLGERQGGHYERVRHPRAREARHRDPAHRLHVAAHPGRVVLQRGLAVVAQAQARQ